jgi:hypothetical protein
MQQRNPIAVALLPMVTLGIYSIYWAIKTTSELNSSNHNQPTVPHGILVIIPIANLYWMWKCSEGVQKYTHNACSQVVSFLLMFFLGCIGQAIVQNYLNKGGAPMGMANGAPPQAPYGPQPQPPYGPQSPQA